ncbi:hypothetical protein [Nocardia wallacei]|uniref:Uncharacterized protein n=1 Tax=Nocardia wallacei TaxID=480035 RepID=A0A7G1KSV8_9NOCA|nr:hypothetical protein [Nocardia wallacei]BCK57293.1 hypothetical protein NWFMUON74_50650 [Nocardia wallacei]
MSAIGGLDRRVEDEHRLLAWQLALFDSRHWRPSALWRRFVGWTAVTRRRWWTVWSTVTVLLLVVFPMIIGAVATAQTSTITDTETSHTEPGNSGLSWMNIHDSSGVPLSRYQLVTDRGSLFEPVNTGISIIINLEFAGWSVLVTSSIWLIGWALSFRWLDAFSSALHGVAVNLTGQLATPLMLITAATVGAFFVAYFVGRGFYTKATLQVVTMLVVAIVGTLFLSEPLGEVLGSNGWLAQGRNLGITVAAGLNGNGNPDPTALVETMQADLADNFARRPLQVWNFGHIVDQRPGCEAMWSAGINSGSGERIKNGMKACGDSAAYAAASDASVSQIGAGLILLLCGGVLLLFAVYLSLKVIKAALDAIYHGFMSIVGFAAGGFIYGPTQTFLIRNVADGFIAAGKMAAYTVFLGFYVLFLGNLFHQAQGQQMAVFFIGAVVMIVAIMQLSKLSDSLDHGNDWVANRFALATQGALGRGGGGGGGGGGRAIGMGQVGTDHHLHGLATFAAVSTVANSPLTEWLLGGLPGSFHPQSRLKAQMARAQGGVWVDETRMGGLDGMYNASYLKWQQIGQQYGLDAEVYGGMDTIRGTAAGVQGVLDAGGTVADVLGAHRRAGGKNEKMALYGARSRQIVETMSKNEAFTDADLSLMVASVQRAQNSSIAYLNRAQSGQPFGRIDAEEVAADYATLRQAVRVYRRTRRGGIDLDGGTNAGAQTAFVERYMRRGTAREAKNDMITALNDVAAGNNPTTAADLLRNGHITGAEHAMLNNLTPENAERMRRWIVNEHAKDMEELVADRSRGLMADITDQQRMRDVRNELYETIQTQNRLTGSTKSPALSVVPSSGNPSHARWRSGLADVARLLR